MPFDPSPRYHRFVALGDSQTEGLNDDEQPGPDGASGPVGPRGWADRLAERLNATTSPGLLYANLAIRGVRARHLREVQLPAALEMRPDLATVIVGMNDVLRHDYDEESVVADLAHGFAALRATGCRVVTMTFPDVSQMIPLMGWLRPREARLNARLTEVAHQYDVDVLDVFSTALAGDPAMWSHDRIHGSTLGHVRVAEGMAGLLGAPYDADWAEPSRGGHSRVGSVARDLLWAGSFMAPFLIRMARGRPPTLDRLPKRPELLPVDPQHAAGAPHPTV